jgi:hypothetical protein
MRPKRNDAGRDIDSLARSVTALSTRDVVGVEPTA